MGCRWSVVDSAVLAAQIGTAPLRQKSSAPGAGTTVGISGKRRTWPGQCGLGHRLEGGHHAG